MRLCLYRESTQEIIKSSKPKNTEDISESLKYLGRGHIHAGFPLGHLYGAPGKAHRGQVWGLI